MKETPAFERILAEWLDDQARPTPPDHVLSAALERTSRTPQGSRRLLVAWRPLSPVLASTRSRLRLVLLLALLLVAALGAAILAGAFVRERDRVPSEQGLIAFERQGDIWVTTPDGTTRQITSTTEAESAPVLSPDGSRLAWLALDGDHAHLVVADPDGSRPTVHQPPAGSIVPGEGPIYGWSADGERVALFARGAPGSAGAGLERVLVLDVGSDRWVVPTVDSGQSTTFGWSPVGSLLGIREIRGWNVALGVLVPGESDPRWLLDESSIYDGARFTHDGRAIVLHRQSSGSTLDGDIVSIDVADGTLTKLIGGPTNDVAPAVSPDGTLLAFARSSAPTMIAAVDPLLADPSSSDLYVMPLAGGTARLLVRDVWPGVVWSPDGRHLLARTRDRQDILLVSLQEGEAPRAGPDIDWHEYQPPVWATGPP